MSHLPYESADSGSSLETYEWDNIWWEKPTVKAVPRVLYVGDSISCGIRRLATAEAGERLIFDGFGSSKALDNPYLKEAIRLAAAQMPACSAIVFNNGLHGWHLDTQSYQCRYEDMLNFFSAEFVGCPCVCLLTTIVSNDPKRLEIVRARNGIVRQIAQKRNLPVVDFFSVSQEHLDLMADDHVHFQEAGYHLLAKELVKHLHKVLCF